MKRFLGILFLALLFFSSCDHIKNPYPPSTGSDLDTSLYPGNWSNYLANEWPTFTQNTNLNRNLLVEDFTGHKCIYCPAAADLAHALHLGYPGRVFPLSIHAGPTGIGDFQVVDAAGGYPTDFTNTDGIAIAQYFGANDGGFIGNPRGTISRINNGGVLFQSPGAWTGMVTNALSQNILKVNMQSALNYYPSTKGAFLHVEIEKLDPNLNNELAVVACIVEDSLIGDQKMSDNSHNPNYIHRDVHRGNLNHTPFGKTLTNAELTNGKYYVNYSFVVPNQLDGNFNAANMHVLVYVYDKSTWEIYQVIEQALQ